MKEALKPIRQMNARSAEDFARAEIEYQREHKKYEIKKAVLETNAKREVRTEQGSLEGTDGSAMAELLALEEPVRPVAERRVVSDVTIEKLGELLIENPRGLLMFRDEVFGLLDSLEREDRVADRAFLMQAWNGSDTAEVDRIGRGARFIPGACLGLVGGVQLGCPSVAFAQG
jgi:hypothetical protein